MWKFKVKVLNYKVDSIYAIVYLMKGSRDIGPREMADGILIFCPITVLWGRIQKLLGTLVSSSTKGAQ